MYETYFFVLGTYSWSKITALADATDSLSDEREETELAGLGPELITFWSVSINGFTSESEYFDDSFGGRCLPNLIKFLTLDLSVLQK